MEKQVLFVTGSCKTMDVVLLKSNLPDLVALTGRYNVRSLLKEVGSEWTGGINSSYTGTDDQIKTIVQQYTDANIAVEVFNGEEDGYNVTILKIR